MYEAMTYGTLLERLLEQVPDDLDKREGSVMYTALAPCAAELAVAYMELDIVLGEAFADTASKYYLIKRCAERGIVLREATHAVVKAVFEPASVDMTDQRLNCNGINFVVTEKITDGEYKLTCEEAGIGGNLYEGDMIPIEFVDGLETACITALLIPGEDEEETESLRKRYFDSLKIQAFGGNRQDYLDKVGALAGVGAVKVKPVWNGGGTVRLTILNSSYEKASDVLIASVQEEVDPGMQGDGWGIAPIGHCVTVGTAEEVEVDITLTITCNEGESVVSIKKQAAEALAAYLAELRKGWAEQTFSVVRIAQIETRILAIPGVIDVRNTLINGVNDNMNLEEHQIPVLGEVLDG